MYASLNGPEGAGIVSALSTDGGLTFSMEDGVRIARETAYELHSVFAPEVVCVGDGSMYRMQLIQPNMHGLLSFCVFLCVSVRIPGMCCTLRVPLCVYMVCVALSVCLCVTVCFVTGAGTTPRSRTPTVRL